MVCPNYPNWFINRAPSHVVLQFPISTVVPVMVSCGPFTHAAASNMAPSASTFLIIRSLCGKFIRSEARTDADRCLRLGAQNRRCLLDRLRHLLVPGGVLDEADRLPASARSTIDLVRCSHRRHLRRQVEPTSPTRQVV